ncbi:MAG: type I secretion C-terminal target domain-containing protein [Pseudomonadota bacterium]
MDSRAGDADVITDFAQGHDRIDVSALLGFTAMDTTAIPQAGHLGQYISFGQTHLTDGHDFDLIIKAALILTNADILHA